MERQGSNSNEIIALRETIQYPLPFAHHLLRNGKEAQTNKLHLRGEYISVWVCVISLAALYNMAESNDLPLVHAFEGRCRTNCGHDMPCVVQDVRLTEWNNVERRYELDDCHTSFHRCQNSTFLLPNISSPLRSVAGISISTTTTIKIVYVHDENSLKQTHEKSAFRKIEKYCFTYRMYPYIHKYIHRHLSCVLGGLWTSEQPNRRAIFFCILLSSGWHSVEGPTECYPPALTPNFNRHSLFSGHFMEKEILFFSEIKKKNFFRTIKYARSIFKFMCNVWNIFLFIKFLESTMLVGIYYLCWGNNGLFEWAEMCCKHPVGVVQRENIAGWDGGPGGGGGHMKTRTFTHCGSWNTRLKF